MEESTDKYIIDIVKSFVLDRKYEMLAIFMDSLDEKRKESLMQYDEFCRALIAFNFEKREFKKVYHILETGKFKETTDLLEVWDQAHYREREHVINKPLNPLMRFRVRKKYPPPKNICPTGERPQHKLPEIARETLKNWFAQHANNPYPSKAQREDLCKATGLTDYQVKTWFSNARRKVKHSTFGGKKEQANGTAKYSVTDSVKPQFYLNPNAATSFDTGEKWCSEWQEWQQKTLGNISQPYNYQNTSLSYDMKFWPSEDYQSQCFKESVFPVNVSSQYMGEPKYIYGDTFCQPLTYQTSANQFCRQCCLRESYEASFQCQYNGNGVQYNGDTEAALMLLDLQKPLISGEFAPHMS
ncbi:homeobox protein SIX4-like [Saccostrea echinata]|uniref:homeobox protein SIX4-like n=1 Tax=Saccostrea echinata TaxID=191078 RepID=UPI002A834914|nr:homeobox protein SIX4-like [Saccostrea echinata]